MEGRQMELTRGSAAAAAGSGVFGVWALVLPPAAAFDGRGLVCAGLAALAVALMGRKAAAE